MICSKDLVPDLSEICQEKYVDCTDVMYSDESGEDTRRVLSPSELVLHSAYHNASGRRAGKAGSGGFCEVNTVFNFFFCLSSLVYLFENVDDYFIIL